MIKNKKLTMVISLLIAIALWVYVAGTLDPVLKKSYSDVQVTIKHEARLEDRGMAVSYCSAKYISVTVQGKKSEVQKLDAEDIHATIDVSKLQVGRNECPVKIKVDGKAKVYDQGFLTAYVTVEKIEKKTKEIVPEFRGTFDSDVEPTLIALSRERVAVRGAKSLVDMVDHVAAVVESEDMENGEENYEARLVAQDANGQTIKNISIAEKTVTVTAVLYQTKEVDLDLEVVGENAGGIERTIEKPDKIIIKGPKEAVEGIQSISAETIDVSDVLENKKIKIDPVLPNGVQLSKDSQALSISVSLDGEISKSFTIKTSEISVNTKSKYSIEDKSVSVTVKGKASVINQLTSKDIKLSLDLGDAKKGQVNAKVMCQVKGKARQTVIKPANLKVTIEED